MGGALEIVHASCGVLVPRANAPALAAVLYRLIQDSAWRNSLAGSGPVRARMLCDPATRMEELHQCLRNVMCRKAAA
jgi:hypothetical protein